MKPDCEKTVQSLHVLVYIERTNILRQISNGWITRAHAQASRTAAMETRVSADTAAATSDASHPTADEKRPTNSNATVIDSSIINLLLIFTQKI